MAQSSTYSLLGQALSSGYSAYSTLQAGVATAGAYSVQARQSERYATWAIDQAKVNNKKLIRTYNETTASQAAMFAAQGRNFSSGTVQNIIQTDNERLQEDLDFNMTEAEKQATAFREDAQGYLSAGSEAKSAAKTESSVGLLGSALSIASAIF